MIDKLKRMAQAIQKLRLPVLALGLIGLTSIIVILLVPESHAGNRLIIPSIVALIWGLSTYSFIVTFLTVPGKPGNRSSFFSKLKFKIIRGWYLIVGVVFMGTTVATILATIRMVGIWLRDYGD